MDMDDIMGVMELMQKVPMSTVDQCDCVVCECPAGGGAVCLTRYKTLLLMLSAH